MSYDTMKLWRVIKKDEKMKAALCYFIGNLFNKGIAFILVPVFSRIMSQEEYGILNTYLSWEAILVVIVGLSLGQSLRSAVYDFQEDIEAYVVSIYALSFVDLIGTFIIITAVVKVFSLEYSIYLLFLCVLHAYFGFAAGVYEVRYMMEFHYVKRTLLLVAPNLLYAIISIPLMLSLYADRYMAGIYGYLISYAVIGIFLIVNTLKGNKKRVNIEYWKYALKFSFPLIAHSLSMVVLSNSDRIMITNIRGSAETAIYSIVYSISMVPLAINASLENVWIPWFSNKLNAGDKAAVNRRVFSYIMVVLLITIGIMLIAPEVLMLLTPKEYWPGKGLIPPIIAASFVMFVYSISADAEYYYKNTGIIAKSTIVAAVSNIVLNALFIPVFGSIAAAYTTLASYLISCVLHICQMKRIDRELFPLKNYIISFVVMGSAMTLEMICMNLFLVRWGAAVIVGVMIFKVLMKVKKQELNSL